MKRYKAIEVVLCVVVVGCSDDGSSAADAGVGGSGGSAAVGAGGTAAAGAGGTGAAGTGGTPGGTGGGGTGASGGTGAVGGGTGGAIVGKTIAVSDEGGCVITPAGDASCWGFLDDQAPLAGTAEFETISAFYGDRYVCALDVSGTASCWDWVSKYDVALSVPLRQISVGKAYACAIKSTDRSIACWLTVSTDPTPILEPPAGAFASIATGTFNACGIQENGTIACWGQNSLQAFDAPAGSFDALGTGLFYSCAIGSAGNACWGGLAVPAQTGSFRALSVAEQYACGVRQDGSIACWGDAAPAGAPTAASFRDVSVATNHACAVHTDGTLECWGPLSASQIPPAGLVVK